MAWDDDINRRDERFSRHTGRVPAKRMPLINQCKNCGKRFKESEHSKIDDKDCISCNPKKFKTCKYCDKPLSGGELDICEDCRASKTCSCCNKKLARYKFIENGTETEYCPTCRQKKTCSSCGKKLRLHKFIENGTETEYCPTCRQKKTCSSCGKKLYLHNFIDQGIESPYCHTCRTHYNKKFKNYPSCGETLERGIFIEKGTEYTYCPKFFSKLKICSSCGHKFIENETESPYCPTCRSHILRYSRRQLKICSSCGRKLFLHNFIDQGIESPYCPSCRESIRIKPNLEKKIKLPTVNIEIETKILDYIDKHPNNTVDEVITKVLNENKFNTTLVKVKKSLINLLRKQSILKNTDGKLIRR